tara:strand:+ start:203 stop:1399 length:1197 start_codon:yes stop_codon:yes gene_type:complete
MMKASDAKEYEKAAVFRDKISAVQTVFDKQKVISTSLEDQDVIACCKGGDVVVAQVLIIRGGKMIGEKSFKMKCHNDVEDNEILLSFLKQYYLGELSPPREILLPLDVEDQELLVDWLSEKKGLKVLIEVPMRGKKKNLVEMAKQNARIAAKNEIESEDTLARMLEELQTSLNLKSFPESIEGFDISNIFGDHAVGSMVAFSSGKSDKERYRRFRIREVNGINDYAMLREVLIRRYGRLLEDEQPLPDLILIDGGKGHLNTGLKVLKNLGLEDKIDIACIAKGQNRNNLKTDEVYLSGEKVPILFRENSPARFLIQRIRDEAHRFAISYHRKLRKKSALTSPLDGVSGIGKVRRLALLKKFGSLEGIRAASLTELQTIPGITHSIAKKIQEAIQVERN